MQIWQEIPILPIAVFPRGAVAEEARSSPHPLGLCPVPLVPLLPAARWAESGVWPFATGFSPWRMHWNCELDCDRQIFYW